MLSTTECPAGLLAHTTVTNCTEAIVSTVSSHIWQCDLQVSSSKVTLTRGSDGTDLTRNRHLTDDSSIGSYKYEVSYCLGTFMWTCTCIVYEIVTQCHRSAVGTPAAMYSGAGSFRPELKGWLY